MPELHSPLPSTTGRYPAPRYVVDPIDEHPPWFNPAAFSDSNFDPESYIADLRTLVPLHTLRAELRSHLSSLHRELVDSINRDYSDFVSLSTKMVDIDASVVPMRAPLFELEEKILAFRGDVESSLIDLKNLLYQRVDASAARQLLELLLDAFHVVSKVEKLIKELPSVPVDRSTRGLSPATKDQLSNGISVLCSEYETGTRVTQSKPLERIACLINRLKFYITLAQEMPFVKSMEKRMQNAISLLDTSLGHCFTDALKHRDASAIYNCLHAYAAIDNTGHAEEIFRTTVVAPFVEKAILHGSSGVAHGEYTDALGHVYSRIKKYLEDDCKFLLEISFAENSGLQGFNFLANSILKEVFTVIRKEKPEAFSPGRPTEFLKNYQASLDFLSHLEGYHSSRAAVAKFRAETVYKEFLKQWNVGVYFSLRFQEIAGALDSALTNTILTPVEGSPSGLQKSESLLLKQSISLLECMRSCWSEDIFVLSCSDKFLRLTLQLISRYSRWLSSGLAARKSGRLASNIGSEWAICATPDELIYILHDLSCLVNEITNNFSKYVLEILNPCSGEVDNLVEKSLSQGAESLKDVLSRVINSVVDTFSQMSFVDSERADMYLKRFLDSEYLTDEVKQQLLQRAKEQVARKVYSIT